MILNLYEVKQVHEGGGMGLVYRVHHRGWNVDLAVKSPRPGVLPQTQTRDKENFEREAETWVKLGLHPHTVSCYYVRRLGGISRFSRNTLRAARWAKPFTAAGSTKEGRGRCVTRILDVAIQFAWVSKYAHEQGLVHQDVKPANVLLTKDGVAKVTDFGLARARCASAEAPAVAGQKSILVSSGGMTPAYCSPEQAAGEKLTRKTDLWSWAASILKMFTGDVTWPSGTVAGEALEGYLETADGSDGMPRMPNGLAVLFRAASNASRKTGPKTCWKSCRPCCCSIDRRRGGNTNVRRRRRPRFWETTSTIARCRCWTLANQRRPKTLARGFVRRGTSSGIDLQSGVCPIGATAT